MSLTSLRNQTDADIDMQYAHGTLYFTGITSKISEAAKMAEDRKQVRRAGVVSQRSIS